MSAPDTVTQEVGDFANRWPLAALFALFVGGAGWLFHVQSANTDRRQADMIALANRFADHLMKQNRTMLALMERCVVVPESELAKYRPQHPQTNEDQ
jgi:hypothetical protein